MASDANLLLGTGKGTASVQVNESNGLLLAHALSENASRLVSALEICGLSEKLVCENAKISRTYLTLLKQDKKPLTRSLMMRLSAAMGFNDSRQVWP